MRVLKNIVEETNISLILLSEISDGVEYRDSFRPKLINVGTSDAVTDLADLVILMYRPYYYTGDEDMEGETELIVAKNSRGPRFTALVYFNNELMRFEEFDAGERF
jgi:replicative DNA helicase